MISTADTRGSIPDVARTSIDSVSDGGTAADAGVEWRSGTCGGPFGEIDFVVR